MGKGSLAITAFVSFLGALLFFPLAHAERPDRLFDLPEQAAAKGLEDVTRLAPDSSKTQKRKEEEEEYAKALGFDSAQEAGNAKRGGSLYIYTARLDQFKNFSGGLRALLRDTSSYIVTLQINGSPKSSVTVAIDPQTNKWHAVEWGNRHLIKLLEQQRQLHSGITFYLVISPANPWGLRFVGEQRGDNST